ncbi:MAG TPA: YkgJ family cysteine cluster protein [Gammaproteobacteria bacterium]|nr:YkgJ family cysteine cluster protein [Gammaproteobacteria bacterium]
MCAAVWNPCLACGACCAFFRASFHWSEADPAGRGLTPAGLTAKLTPHRAVMRGTEKTPPRCVALRGTIGKNVHCAIHALRPSPCREFQASWVDGLHNERCDRARAAHGLPPLSLPGDSRKAPSAP